MLEDIGFNLGQTLGAKILRKLGLPEDWQPKNKWLRIGLWLAAIVGAIFLGYLVVLG